MPPGYTNPRFEKLKVRNLRIVGDTYAHKEAIKRAGGMWDNGARVWLVSDEATQRRMQRLVDGKGVSEGVSEGVATPPKPVGRPTPPLREAGPASYAYARDADLAGLRLKVEALGLVLSGATEDTALALAHKVGEVLTKLALSSNGGE